MTQQAETVGQTAATAPPALAPAPVAAPTIATGLTPAVVAPLTIAAGLTPAPAIVGDATLPEQLAVLPAGAWGRNPFLTPEEEAMGRRGGTQGQTIHAIITGRGRSVAALDGRMVSVGDSIGDEVVVEIRRDAVVLERNGRRRILRVQELSRISNGVRIIEK